MPIDFYYHPLSPPCRPVMITAKLLNINMNYKVTVTSVGETKTPEFLKMNPQHCIPTIVDGDFVLWESHAICAYLCNQYAPDSHLYPKNPKKRAVVDLMLNFDHGTFSPTIGAGFVYKLRCGFEPAPEKVKDGIEMLKLLNTLIGNKKFVAGNKLTIADITIVTMVSMLEFVNVQLTPYPNIKKWYERMYKECPVLDEMRIETIEMFKERMKNQ